MRMMRSIYTSLQELPSTKFPSHCYSIHIRVCVCVCQPLKITMNYYLSSNRNFIQKLFLVTRKITIKFSFIIILLSCRFLWKHSSQTKRPINILLWISKSCRNRAWPNIIMISFHVLFSKEENSFGLSFYWNAISIRRWILLVMCNIWIVQICFCEQRKMYPACWYSLSAIPINVNWQKPRNDD